MSRSMCCVLIGSLVAGLIPAAQADLPRDIYRSLELFTTPSGNNVSSLSGGLRVNGSRVGQTRIEPNILGDGWELIVDRTFGPDSSGRAETFDLGPVDLTLQGSTATTANYTTRGFLQANLNTQVSALNYALSTTTGVIDATLSGQLDMNNTISINEFGFYELRVDIDQSNAQLLVETLGETDTTDMNYTVGPVDVRGNLFFDAFVGVLSFLGVDTSALDPYTSRSAIAAITDELNASLTDALAEQGYALDTANGEVALTALSASTVSTVGDDTAQYVGPVLPDADEDDASSAAPLAANVPEPATLVLFSLTLLAIRRR